VKVKKISVYDPSAEDCCVAAEALRELFDRSGVRAVVMEFSNYEKFSCDFRDNYYDMAFVGIGSVLDLEAARAVRGIDEKCPLCLMSHEKDYSLEGYRLNALDFIVKPVTVPRLREAVCRAPLF